MFNVIQLLWKVKGKGKRESFTKKVTFELAPEEYGGVWYFERRGKDVPGGGNSICEGPEAWKSRVSSKFGNQCRRLHSIQNTMFRQEERASWGS